MVNELPRIKIDGIEYVVDEQLGEMREAKRPWVRETIEIYYYWKKHQHDKE